MKIAFSKTEVDPRKNPLFTNLFNQLTGKNNTQDDTVSSSASSADDTNLTNINWRDEIRY
jgi:hypothetical protein